ncbi:MAG: hypothetical protein KHW57_08370 [Clostridium sp.]|nr:hypothetical protein [Clostridium sp.]
MKYSKNVKLNAVLNEIESDLLENMEISEIRRYMKEFPNESDYSIADFGNMLVYYSEIRKMYINAGYKTFENNKISDSKMWEIYKRQVGYVARQIIKTA